MTKKVLITGGAGFIGSHTVNKFIEEGNQVKIIDDLSSGLPENVNPHVVHLDCDVSDYDYAIKKLILQWNPDIIIHLAAQPSLLYSMKLPDYDAKTNIIGTLNMVELAKRCGAHFVFSSTSAVYKENPDGAYYEYDECEPASPYGLSKLTAEKYIRMLLPKEQYTILRYGNVYGPRQVPLGENQLIPRAIRHMLYNDQFEVYGDGKQKRDFVHVYDVAQANYQAATEKWLGVYNISSGRSYSVNDILEHLDRIHGRAMPWLHGRERDHRSNITMDNGRAWEKFWKPTIGIHAGLKLTYDWWVQYGKEQNT